MSSASSTVCQGLQTCLEPILLEPRVLMHQLTPSKQGLSFPYPQRQIEIPHNSQKPCPIEKIMCQNRNTGQESKNTWSFIQSLTKNSYNFREESTEESKQVYVHPLAKSSVSCLSSRSLEMCTESLGSETGSCIDSNVDEFSYQESEKQSFSRIKPTKTREFPKKVKQSSNFPPPLTSISGSDGVHVQTHREGGRLVIKAYNYSSCSSNFQAERGNGRLRLSLFRDPENEEEEEDVEGDVEENVDEPEKIEDGENDNDDDEDEVDLNGRLWGENGGKVGRKIGGGEWSGSSRCNGDRNSSKRLPSLPCWVAIT